MSLVEEPIRVGTESVRRDVDAEPEGAGDLALRLEAHPSESAGFEVDDDGSPDARPICQVLLPPAMPLPQGADQPAELDVVHGPTMKSGPYRRITACQWRSCTAGPRAPAPVAPLVPRAARRAPVPPFCRA